MRAKQNAKRAPKPRNGPSSIPARKARRVKSLQKYLRAYGTGLDGRRLREAFAKRAGTTLGYLAQIAWGFRKTSADLSIRIERASHGLVPIEDLRPDLDLSYLTTRKARTTTTETRP